MDSELVYITNANFDKIIRKIDSRSICPDYSKIYKSDLRSILSIPELNLLYITMEAYKDFNLLVEKYNIIERSIDRKKYAFEGGFPTYHFSSECERIKSDFVNLEIPPEIKKKGDDAISEFRTFCREYSDVIRTDPNKFQTMIEARFFIKSKQNIIKYKNTGYTSFENLDLEQLEKRIDLLIIDSEKFRCRDEETEKLIKNKGFGTNRVSDAKVKGSTLNIWHEKYKGELKRLLHDYFRVKFNPDLKFKGQLLEQLGFRPCHTCSTKTYF